MIGTSLRICYMPGQRHRPVALVHWWHVVCSLDHGLASKPPQKNWRVQSRHKMFAHRCQTREWSEQRQHQANSNAHVHHHHRVRALTSPPVRSVNRRPRAALRQLIKRVPP